MDFVSVDRMILEDNWSDLRRFQEIPEIDFARLHDYRLGRIRTALTEADAAMCVLISPISMRYAVNFRNYALFQSHIPSTYLFISVDGPVLFHNAYEPSLERRNIRNGRGISFFEGGSGLKEQALLFAHDINTYLQEIGTDNRRVAVEYVNPSITQALEGIGLEVIDGVAISEQARLIKSDDEIACMRWAIEVAGHGIARVKQALKPGVSELQLWALLNYTNLANNGDWHDGRMLASGPRINPWLQEASDRRLESGDLIGLDTDMIGPFGYFADISRTFYCGTGNPTRRQKQLYRLAMDEIEHNLTLVQPGITLSEFQLRSYDVPEEFHENAYPCIIHAVGMSDEYPQVKPKFRGPVSYDTTLEAGMVICVESYMGAVGERDGVKLEQQVLVTDSGYELLTTYPFEDTFID
jgi:Xaa-Pro aminopeptidase